MKAKKICPRCHRLKHIRDGGRYCDGCLEKRKQEEAPRRPKEEPK